MLYQHVFGMMRFPANVTAPRPREISEASPEHLSLTKNNQALRKIKGSPAYDLYEKIKIF